MSPSAPLPRAARLVPEVIQTSAMDCGPAVLKAALEGFGVSVHLGHLRTACQTDVDGTSIDTLEDLAARLGMRPVQTIVPIEHVADLKCLPLPAVVVTANPDGSRHFVLLWRRFGPFVQVMDPASGRRHVRMSDLLPLLHRHSMVVPPDTAGRWAGSSVMRGGLQRRLARLGAAGLLDQVGSFTDLGTLAQATTAAEELVASGAMKRAAAGPLIEALTHSPELLTGTVPPVYDADKQAVLSGAVVLCLSAPDRVPVLTGSLGRALTHRSPPLWGQLIALLRTVAPGLLPLAVLMAAVSALGGVAQSAMFRALIDADRWLPAPAARAGGIAVLLVLSAAMVGISVAWSAVLARAARALELRLRVRFHARLPRLDVRYFTSRLQSDLAERAHSLVALNTLPAALTRVFQSSATLLATLGALVWLDPGLTPIVLLAVAVSFAAPALLHPLLASRELRRQTFDGALARTYLDAMLGAVPIRAHGAEEAVRRDHEALLTGWQGAARQALYASVAAGAVQGVVGIGLAAWMVADHLARAPHAGAVLLLVYWAVGIPGQGKELAAAARTLPALQSVAARIFETLDAPADPVSSPGPLPEALTTGPIGLRARGLVLRAGGQDLLRVDHLDIQPGERVAIVGPSGAGKSTLLGALLGWLPIAEGGLNIGSHDATPELLRALRRRVAWVDPTVRIWNRSLLDNLRYGQESGAPPDAQLLEDAELIDIVADLPEGLSTPLGADGGTLSGGQGQRVRLGRALGRPDVGLVLLDEAFRGLDRHQRGRLLDTATARWGDATLLCVTHDLEAAATFPRVVVIDGGRIVEDGSPEAILAQGGLYARLLAEHRATRAALLYGAQWRQVHVGDGTAQEVSG